MGLIFGQLVALNTANNDVGEVVMDNFGISVRAFQSLYGVPEVNQIEKISREHAEDSNIIIESNIN